MKKALSWILVLCMVLALVPAQVLAAPAANTAPGEYETQEVIYDGVDVRVVEGSEYGSVELSTHSLGQCYYLDVEVEQGYKAEFEFSWYKEYGNYEFEYSGNNRYHLVKPTIGGIIVYVSFVKISGSSYNVTASANEGGTYELSTTSAKEGEHVYLYVTPDVGYVLGEKSVTSDDAGCFFVDEENDVYRYEVLMPDEDVHINVEFERDGPYYINAKIINYSGMDVGTLTMDKTEYYGGEDFYITLHLNEGCTFDHYDSRIPLTQCGDNQWKGTVPPRYPYSIVVNFYVTTPAHSITVNVTGNVGGTAYTTEKAASAGQSVTLCCIPDPGYQIASVTATPAIVQESWSNFEEGIYAFGMPNEPVTLNVTFEPLIYPVNVKVDANGIGGTAFADVTEAPTDGAVTLTCIPDEGYRVAQITGVDGLVDNGDGTYTFTMPGEAVDVHVLFLRNENPFLDVNETQFFYDPVLWAVEKGITNGIDATHFGPFLTTNRAAVVTMLWRYAGSPEPVGTENPFTDVPADSFYADAVLWAVENGITNGISADQFGPDRPCNRAQVVTFLWRAWNQPESQIAECPFTDVEAGSFYEEAVLWAVENGITTGATDTTFNPNGDCLRAQFVTFLYRAFAEE